MVSGFHVPSSSGPLSSFSCSRASGARMRAREQVAVSPSEEVASVSLHPFESHLLHESYREDHPPASLHDPGSVTEATTAQTTDRSRSTSQKLETDAGLLPPKLRRKGGRPLQWRGGDGRVAIMMRLERKDAEELRKRAVRHGWFVQNELENIVLRFLRRYNDYQ